MTPAAEWGKGNNPIFNIFLQIGHLFPFIIHNSKERGIKGRVLFVSLWSCYFRTWCLGGVHALERQRTPGQTHARWHHPLCPAPCDHPAPARGVYPHHLINHHGNEVSRALSDVDILTIPRFWILSWTQYWSSKYPRKMTMIDIVGNICDLAPQTRAKLCPLDLENQA